MLLSSMRARLNVCVSNPRISLAYTMYVPEITLNNKALSCVPIYRYFGVIVNDKLDDDDIMRHVRSFVEIIC